MSSTRTERVVLGAGETVETETEKAATGSDDRSASKTWRDRAVAVSPYVITAGVLAFLFTRYDVDVMLAHVRQGDPLPVVAAAFGLVLVTLFAISLADHWVIKNVAMAAGVEAPDYRDVLGAKAGSSLLDIVGYAAGHGGYALWIARKTACGGRRSAGAMLYIMAADLLAVSSVAAAAMAVGGLSFGGPLIEVASGVSIVLAALLFLGPYKLLGDGGGVFAPWSEVPRRVGFAQTAIRAGCMVLWGLAIWIASRGFGLALPFAAVMTLVPVILLVSALPINVAGFGAVQTVWLLFEGWATGEHILAFQLVWTLALTSGIVLRGLPFVRRFVAQIDRGSKDATASD